MTEEYVYQRERELLDYFRNNLTDPTSPARSTAATDTFTATAGQTVFTLTNTLVKNVRETITVAGVTKRKGYDFSVTYGEGSGATTVTLNTGATLSDAVVVTYTYGSSMVEREFSRTDVTLPRVIIMHLTGSEEPAALNDDMGDGTTSGQGSYFNVSFRVEIRDKYANRARTLASQAFNLGQKMRHANLFRTNITNSTDMQNFDYDIEKDAYIWQFTINIQWEIIFI